MDKHRDKLPQLLPDSEESEGGAEESPTRIPEEATEIYELVEESGVEVPAPPPPAPRPQAPELPEETVSELRALRAKIEHKDRQIEQVMEAYRGKKEETEKLRKRIEKTERRRFEQSKGDFIARFVEVLDNLDRAIDSIENAFDPDAVLQGIMLVRSRLVQLLKEEGLEKIFVRGQIYDPTHSEAAGMEPVPDESQDGIVLRELQPGYMLKGSLLRVARVVVGRHGTDSAETKAAPAETKAAPAESSEATTAARTPTVSPPAPGADADDSRSSWEADNPGQELEFSEDGLDFSNE
ncbi:MAG TPA: nucleotide exchange factor GrpE [Vicinamibacteria bacterium]|nr:nucleotide exchange factor GrpE [Vicinamibacteria bacterium]